MSTIEPSTLSPSGHSSSKLLFPFLTSSPLFLFPPLPFLTISQLFIFIALALTLTFLVATFFLVLLQRITL